MFAWEGATQKRLGAISTEIKKMLTKAVADSEANLCAEMAKVFEGTGYSFDPEAETSSDSDFEEEQPPAKSATKPKAKAKPSDSSKGSCSDAPNAAEVVPPVAEVPEGGNASTTVAGSTGREGAEAEVVAAEAPASSTPAEPAEGVAAGA